MRHLLHGFFDAISRVEKISRWCFFFLFLFLERRFSGHLLVEQHLVLIGDIVLDTWNRNDSTRVLSLDFLEIFHRENAGWVAVAYLWNVRTWNVATRGDKTRVNHLLNGGGFPALRLFTNHHALATTWFLCITCLFSLKKNGLASNRVASLWIF